MLTESFIASIIRPDSVSSHVQHKDAGVYFHELQPLPGIKSILKKSSTKSNCLAATSTHVFAAQADKAVVHVYNIERGTQECLVPFPQKITSLALVGHRASNGVLVLGDEAGRVVLWELATGRQVSSPAAHLQAVTCLAVDPTNNFLLSGSADTNVHVWSISALLSFASNDESYAERDSSAPLHTLANHRGAVNALAVGHSTYSANVAVSASQDNSCIVWDYQGGHLLHTFLLTSAPLSVGLDPADRGFYVGLTDGSVQMIDFYAESTVEHSTHSGRHAAPVTEPPKADRWPSPGETSPACSLAVTYDGTKVLTGHENGKLYIRDVGTGKFVGDHLAALLGPVTNLAMLPVQGLVRHGQEATTVLSVVKPKHVALFKVSENGGGNLPDNYTVHACFKEALPLQASHIRGRRPTVDQPRDLLMADFISVAFNSGYPRDLLDEDIASLRSGDGPDGPRSIFGATFGKGESEVEELHKLVARTTQESLELRDRVESLGKDLVHMRQAERDRKRLKKIKQSKRAQANELRRKAYMEGSLRTGTTESGPPLESSSGSDDMSLGG